MSSSENDSATDIKQPPRLTRRRRWMFRLAAILIGLSPFLLLEVVFRVADIGRQRELGDPYIGFSAIHPLFELNAAGDCYEVAASRQEFFRPDRFLASKPQDEFRVFCLGGSTVQGRPFAIETSFTTWLELSLQAAAPNTKWRVVNCGGVSYASYRLAPIMEEILAYEPDLIILYTGHNEFLEGPHVQRCAGRSVVRRLGALHAVELSHLQCGEIGMAEGNQFPQHVHER